MTSQDPGAGAPTDEATRALTAEITEAMVRLYKDLFGTHLSLVGRALARVCGAPALVGLALARVLRGVRAVGGIGRS